nr:AAA family ATPase [Pseudomonas sp. P818]
MKIENLKILNFRGIREVTLSNLGNMIIIAGQNGSGKSCIFDAIRLLKSVYGGYQPNEWQQWMGEFQINLTNRSSDFASIFNDASKELRISCDIRLSDAERKYITENADELLREKIWRTMNPEAYGWGSHRMAVFAAQFRDKEPEVLERIRTEHPILMKEIAAPTVRGEFFIRPGEFPQIQNSLTLSVIFSTFRPTEIGVIDYHGAQRHYGRESVQGINLNLEANEQQRSQTALYNYSSKYHNVKGEMAASYVNEILAEKAGLTAEKKSTLTSTLKELFTTFFPDKKFLGPKPTINGALTFPVETSTGRLHDLDELSSGEKEILYGYLRIRNSAPKHSIILLDEPELHLNPRLIRGLPQFYKKNLGEAIDNQIWLVTHSDALLREVVGREHYNVFHMLPCTATHDRESQLRSLSATADLDLALVDLVGDLASYRPGGKVLIFEGGGDTDFDQKVVSALFPEVQEQVNMISGTNKTRVRALHEILQKAATNEQIPFKVFSITDKDQDTSTTQNHAQGIYSWDVYHIENYFLEARFINKVLTSLNITNNLEDEALWDELRQCAQETLPQLIRHELADFSNKKIIGAINTKTDPKAANISKSLSTSISQSIRRLSELQDNELHENELENLERELQTKYNTSIANGTWTKNMRGRDILKRFVSKHGNGISYESFRNLILSQMRDQGFRPEGMRVVIDAILASQ